MVQSQMKPAPLLRIASSAMKATTWLSIGASWIGLSTTRSITTPAANEMHDRRGERDPVGEAPLHQLPGDEGREHRHLALREIQVVDRLVDHHHGERHAGIDAARREPRQHLMQKQFHTCVPSVAEIGAADVFVVAQLLRRAFGITSRPVSIR